VVVVSSSVTCGSSARPETRSEQHHLGAEPLPDYFASKVAQEQAALEIGRAGDLEVVVACPTVVLGGPSQRLVPSNAILLRYLLDPTRSTYPGGGNIVSAADVGAGLALLADRGEPGERYLLGSDNLSWRTLHATIGDLVGVGGPYLELPAPATYAGSAVAELWARVTGGDALTTREEARTVGRYYWYDHAKAAVLGYRPGPSRSAIAAGLAWLLVDGHLPRWVREALRPTEEVRRARPLTPRPLTP
jgi:dihydroflavonol-4-reductase